MSRRIIAAIRQQKQLRTVTRTIALEIAHRMSSSGVGHLAYSYLADKAACCERTAIRHVKKLVHLGLFRVHHTHTPAGYGWNRYEYVGPPVSPPVPPATTRYDWQSEKFPRPASEEEKMGGIRAKITKLRDLRSAQKVGGFMWARFTEDITTLEALCIAPS
jgi:hypothetical protein